MTQLTAQGQQEINNIAQRYNLSANAVTDMLIAVSNGGGSMAQFNIPELGGSGQWMQGGMTMTSDMFNHSLNATVNNLCGELSNLLNSNITVFEPQKQGQSNSWWPAEFGNPASSGGQNNMRYAYFPAPVCRLAIDNGGEVSVFDTLDHQISGVSQQQGGGNTLQFTSQYGNVNTLSLPLISGPGTDAPQQVNQQAPAQPEPQAQQPTTDAGTNSDVFAKIEKLHELMQKGFLTEQEFASKKQELLSQI